MRVIETAWLDYRAKVIPDDASGTQIHESKKAFYAGAGSLLNSILKILGPGQEPTESDLIIMDGIADEVGQYFREVIDREQERSV